MGDCDNMNLKMLESAYPFAASFPERRLAARQESIRCSSPAIQGTQLNYSDDGNYFQNDRIMLLTMFNMKTMAPHIQYRNQY